MNFCPRARGRPARATQITSREDILQTAFSAFAQSGYDGVSLRQLAMQCGVSDSLLHHYFGSKQQLWQQTVDQYITPLMADLMANLQTLAQQDEAASALRKNLPLALKRLMGAPVALTFLFREGEADSERGHYLRTTYLHPYLHQLDQLFEQATAAGHFRTVAPAARHVLVTGFLRTLVVPGLLQQELNPHLQNTDTINALIDDAVSILFEGFSLTLPPFSAGANHE